MWGLMLDGNHLYITHDTQMVFKGNVRHRALAHRMVAALNADEERTRAAVEAAKQEPSDG